MAKIIIGGTSQFPTWVDEDDIPFPSNFFVYCYKNKINDKCYIGKTNNIVARKAKHRRLSFVEKSPLPFYNALRKYGEDNFDFTILDSFYLEDIIFDLEKFHIKNNRSNQSDYGYNLTAGGEGSSGMRHNENQKKANSLRTGAKNGNSRLTDELCFSIFDDYKSGNHSMSELSSKYNVSSITIERLLSGKSWKYLNLDIDSLKNVKRENIRNSNERGFK